MLTGVEEGAALVQLGLERDFLAGGQVETADDHLHVGAEERAVETADLGHGHDVLGRRELADVEAVAAGHERWKVEVLVAAGLEEEREAGVAGGDGFADHDFRRRLPLGRVREHAEAVADLVHGDREKIDAVLGVGVDRV